MKLIYVATLLLAGLDFSLFQGAVMAEASIEFEKSLRDLWAWFRR